jgi:hypothetical protein
MHRFGALMCAEFSMYSSLGMAFFSQTVDIDTAFLGGSIDNYNNESIESCHLGIRSCFSSSSEYAFRCLIIVVTALAPIDMDMASLQH